MPRSPSPPPAAVDAPHTPPPTETKRTFSELVNNHFVEYLLLPPDQLLKMVDLQILRDIRPDGVRRLKQTIAQSGWSPDSLLIATRPSNPDNKLRLLDGSHRARALQELAEQDNPPPWLKPPTSPNPFKVKVKILHGLTTEEELQIAREANRICSTAVPMSLVDHVVAMTHSLEQCRALNNLEHDAHVPYKMLIRTHPDYSFHGQSSVNRWRSLAQALGTQSFQYLRDLQTEQVDNIHPHKFLHAFSRKTLIDCKAMVDLQTQPGAQFWYLKHLAWMSTFDEENLAHQNVDYFRLRVKLLIDIADLLETFADYLDTKCKQNKIANVLRYFVHSGVPKPPPTGPYSPTFKKCIVHCLTNYSSRYLYKCDQNVIELWEEVLFLRKSGKRWYPANLKELFTELRFYKVPDWSKALAAAEKILGYRKGSAGVEDPIIFAEFVPSQPQDLSSSESDSLPITRPRKRQKRSKKKQAHQESEEQHHGEHHSQHQQAPHDPEDQHQEHQQAPQDPEDQHQEHHSQHQQAPSRSTPDESLETKVLEVHIEYKRSRPEAPERLMLAIEKLATRYADSNRYNGIENVKTYEKVRKLPSK